MPGSGQDRLKLNQNAKKSGSKLINADAKTDRPAKKNESNNFDTVRRPIQKIHSDVP